MRKVAVFAAAGGVAALAGVTVPAMAATAPPPHYSSSCQAQGTMYQNDGSGANPVSSQAPNNPTVDLPSPLPSQDTGWSYTTTDSTGQTQTVSGSNGNGATGISGSDGYLEANGDPTTASGHISGSTEGQAGAVPLDGYIGNDGTGNGTVCVAGTTLVP